MTRQLRRPILRATLLLVVLLAAAAATAGSLGLSTDKARHRAPTLEPRLVIVEGVLQQGRLGAWLLDGEVPLDTPRDLQWYDEYKGRETYPSAGRTARLAGQWYGNVFRISHAMLVSQDRMVQRMMVPPVAPTGEESEQLPE